LGLAALLTDFRPPGKVFIIVEERVSRLHGYKLPNGYTRLVLPSLGEDLKQGKWLHLLLDFFCTAKISRSDWVLAVGGGALTDLVSFAASIYKRGIKIALAPTTLLAQVDASVGGKCGINWRGTKNQVGNFYFPSFIFCAPDVLDTLPRRQLLSGMAEVYKYQLLQLRGEWHRFRVIGRGELAGAVEACCRYKNSLVAQDPLDTGPRLILNFGHTLAHALEALDEGMLHGEAVAWGMEYALRIAEGRGNLPDGGLGQVLKVLARQPRRRLPELDFAQVYAKMSRDKKNSTNQVRMIVPGSRGDWQLISPTRKELEENWNALTT